MEYIKIGTDDRIFAIAQLMWLGVDYNRICNITGIDMLFLDKIHNIVALEREIKDDPFNPDALWRAKRMGFSDKHLAHLWKCAESDVAAKRKELGIVPVYKMIDTCASEFESYIPYFYSTYPSSPSARRSLSSARARSASGRAWSSTTPPSTR